jgi:hypothetical protein
MLTRFFLITFLLTLFFWSGSSYAQLSEGGTPYSFHNLLRNPVTSYQMPPIDIKTLLEEDAKDEKEGIPFRFGYPIEVDLNIKRDGTFELLPNGDKLWSLHIYAQGASSINLNYNDFWLPAGAKLYLFNDDKSELIGAFTKRNNKENGEFATGILRGDGVTLEYYEPAVVESPGIINISSVVHGYKDVFKKLEGRDFGQSGACNNNTICPEGEPWSNEIRAAAMILTSGGSRLCSGSMINNVRQDLTPYFLTANHCGSSSSWIIMFRYESPQCSPSVNGPLNYTVQGTQLKASNTASDFALFLLTEAPPDSYMVHFAGWSAVDVPATNSVGIHHPRGDVKKISFDYDPPTSHAWSGTPANSHWRIGVWDDGTTEPGSSGSPLYDQNHRITGQLHGGLASCTVLDYDSYGKFAFSWDYGTTPSTRVKDWLDPDNTGTLVLDGWDPTIGDPDTIPPTTITDLAVVDPTSNSLRLTWTAPLDTSYGGVKVYDIRISNAPINDTTAFQNATPVSFSGQPAGAGVPESFEVTGLDFTTTYYFAIRARDFWQNWSDISNSPGGTTFGAPQASVNPATVHMTLMNNTITTETVTLSNISSGNSTLDYQVTLDNNTFPEGVVNWRAIPKNNDTELGEGSKDNPEVYYGQGLFGFGGPDAFGYKWIDSNEPNGPQYVWEDIVSNPNSVQITGWLGNLDDGYTSAIPIGFGFDFYGTVYSNIYVSTNGFLSLTALSSSYYTNAAIPSTSAPNNIICPFWDDLEGRTQGTVHYLQDGNRFIVQYTNWQFYSSGGGVGSLTFQIVLHSSGKMLYYYNNMVGTLTSATVGIENQTGTIGLQVVYNSAYVQNNMAVKIAAEPDWLGVNPISGRLYNGNSVDIELTFMTEDFSLGDYSMDLIVSSNDPLNPTITVPVTMEIVPIPVELSSFSVAVDKNNVTLSWTTASEVNNSGFEIEKTHVIGKTSSTQGEWQKVGFTEGKGSTTQVQSYSFSDNNLQVGKCIYRLKQIDFDGSYEYSPEVEADILPPQEYSLMQNYPNPFNPSTTIEYTLPENAEVRVDIYSVLGELVTTLVNRTIEAGYQKLSFDATSLPSGTYIYRLNAKGQTKTFVDIKKMMLVK